MHIEFLTLSKSTNILFENAKNSFFKVHYITYIIAHFMLICQSYSSQGQNQPQNKPLCPFQRGSI